MSKTETETKETEGNVKYLFGRIHIRESSLVTVLATLARQILNLLLWTVGEVSGVPVRGHFVLDCCELNKRL